MSWSEEFLRVTVEVVMGDLPGAEDIEESAAIAEDMEAVKDRGKVLHDPTRGEPIPASEKEIESFF